MQVWVGVGLIVVGSGSLVCQRRNFGSLVGMGAKRGSAGRGRVGSSVEVGG